MNLEDIKDVLSYDPITGGFTWLKQRGPIRAGDVAGSAFGEYWSIRIFGRTVLAHRLAVMFMCGAFPGADETVDHIDGDKRRNAWSNLRIVSQGVNNQNLRKARRGSKSGLLGAHWNQQEQKWQASIRSNGTQHYLGRYSTPDEAHAVYVEAKRRLHDGCTI